MADDTNIVEDIVSQAGGCRWTSMDVEDLMDEVCDELTVEELQTRAEEEDETDHFRERFLTKAKQEDATRVSADQRTAHLFQSRPGYISTYRYTPTSAPGLGRF